jgi:hypothetical protein
MDEDPATRPAVPGRDRRPPARLIDQAEAGPGTVIAAGATGCPGRWRRRYRCESRVVRLAAYPGAVKFAHQGDVVRPSEGRRQHSLSLAS